MKDRVLQTAAKGHGLNVRCIQQMPTPRNIETTTAAIVAYRPA